jgi:hypothetical protein
MTLCGRLHADLFHQPLDIPAGVPINVKLDLNSDKKVLMAAVDGNFELKLISAKLLVQSKKLKPDLVYAHQKMAMKSNYKIPYIKVTVKENLLTPNSTSLALNNFHTGRMPNRITLCMVATSAHNGEYNENPFNFRNFGLTDLQLTVGSRTIPHEPLKMNYTLGDYAEAYLSTLASLGIDQGDRAISLTPEEWATAYNVYTFKLAAGDISTGVLNSSTATSVDITVNGTFANPLPAHVTVLSYIEHSDVLEIDHLRNVV